MRRKSSAPISNGLFSRHSVAERAQNAVGAEHRIQVALQPDRRERRRRELAADRAVAQKSTRSLGSSRCSGSLAASACAVARNVAAALGIERLRRELGERRRRLRRRDPSPRPGARRSPARAAPRRAPEHGRPHLDEDLRVALGEVRHLPFLVARPASAGRSPRAARSPSSPARSRRGDRAVRAPRASARYRRTKAAGSIPRR